MLFTIGVMALAVSLEPFRIGMTVLMLNRPKPLLQLLAFVAGGFAMGLTVGATVLFLLRRVLLRSTYFTLPRVQILIGALALAAAAGLATKIAADRRRGSRGVPPDRDRAGPAWLTTRLRRLLDGRSCGSPPPRASASRCRRWITWPPWRSSWRPERRS